MGSKRLESISTLKDNEVLYHKSLAPTKQHQLSGVHRYALVNVKLNLQIPSTQVDANFWGEASWNKSLLSTNTRCRDSYYLHIAVVSFVTYKARR